MKSCLLTPILALLFLAVMVAMFVTFWAVPLALFLFWGGWLTYQRLRPSPAGFWLGGRRPAVDEPGRVELRPTPSDPERGIDDQR